MTSKAAHSLKALLKGGDGGDGFPSKFFAVVAAVRPNGSVDLHWGGAVIPAVPAGSGYPPWMRKPGDKVAVEVYDGGDLLVTTSAGTNEYPPGTGPAQPTQPAQARLAWGAEEPGEDWSPASSVFLRKRDDGPSELYAQTEPGAPENPIEDDAAEPVVEEITNGLGEVLRTDDATPEEEES